MQIYPLHWRLGGTVDSWDQSTRSGKSMLARHYAGVENLKVYIFDDSDFQE
jgi:hypothetical protein